MVFVNPHRGYLNVMRTQNSEERFKAYSGKVIHDISIVVLPPYGTSVYDTTYFEEDMGWLEGKDYFLVDVIYILEREADSLLE